MIEREFRFSDLPRLAQLQEEGFPEENALFGIQPKEIERLVRKLDRWHLRLMLGFLRVVGRPFFLFPIVEDDGAMVATTLLSFGARHGYVSMVMVDPKFRRRGYARRLLTTAQRWTRRRHKPYVVLDVLANNTPARRLYEELGYRELRATSAMVRDVPAAPSAAPAAEAAVRPFAKADVPRLKSIAQQALAPAVADVLPVRGQEFGGTGWASRMFATDSAAWVVDRGDGPVAYLAASVTPATVAAHFSAPIVGPAAGPVELAALIDRGLRWVAEHRAPRVVAVVPQDQAVARAALLAAGFRDAIPIVTLYRPSA